MMWLYTSCKPHKKEADMKPQRGGGGEGEPPGGNMCERVIIKCGILIG